MPIIWTETTTFTPPASTTSSSEEAKTKGLQVVSDNTFTDASANDFSVQLNDAKSKGADLVFLPMYYQPASLILTQANAMGYAPKFFGVDGMDGILTMEGFDPKLGRGCYAPDPVQRRRNR